MNKKSALIVATAGVAVAILLVVVAWNVDRHRQDEKPCRDAASAAVMAGRSGPDTLRECLNLVRIVREHGLE